jgi:hypothetical protein
MDNLIIFLGSFIILASIAFLVKRSLLFGYTYCIAYNLLKEMRTDQEHEVEKLLNEQGF